MTSRVVVVTTAPRGSGTVSMEWRPFDLSRGLDGGLSAEFAAAAMRVAEAGHDGDVVVLGRTVELPERLDPFTESQDVAASITEWIDNETDCWVSETAEKMLVIKASTEQQEA